MLLFKAEESEPSGPQRPREGPVDAERDLMESKLSACDM